MNKAVKIIIGILVFIAVLIGIVFWMTSGMVETADLFFKEIKAKEYQKAYSSLSEDFKANTTQEKFIKFLEKSALLNFKETSWSTRSTSGGRGKLDGSVITETGGVIPIKLGFVKENDVWKIYSIHKPTAGLKDKDVSEKMPSLEKLKDLTQESLGKFGSAVNAKDFTEFHSYVANLWKKEITVVQFNDAFKPFIENEVNILPVLERYLPIFDETPSISEDSILSVKGHYPTRQSRFLFELDYIYEGIGWKLISTSVNVQPVQ